MNRYFLLATDGNTYGPYTIDELLGLAKSGRLSAASNLRDESTGQTMVATAVPQLASHFQILGSPGPGPVSQPFVGQPFGQAPPPSFGGSHMESGPGASPYAPYTRNSPVQVKSYLVEAILSTLCCCTIFGIVAIVHAVQSQSAASRGDVATAMARAELAKKWVIAAVISGIILAPFVFFANSR